MHDLLHSLKVAQLASLWAMLYAVHFTDGSRCCHSRLVMEVSNCLEWRTEGHLGTLLCLGGWLIPWVLLQLHSFRQMGTIPPCSCLVPYGWWKAIGKKIHRITFVNMERGTSFGILSKEAKHTNILFSSLFCFFSGNEVFPLDTRTE